MIARTDIDSMVVEFGAGILTVEQAMGLADKILALCVRAEEDGRAHGVRAIEGTR